MPADVHGISRRMGFGSLSALLRHLDADIVCLQEIKCAALGAPERAIALAEGYDSFFALCRTHTPSTSYGRYAGTATFVKTHCRPHRAEEGVTGVLLSGASSSAPAVPSLALPNEPTERELDGEGRCVLTVHGDLALLNVYVPAVTSDDDEKRERRAEFKAAFLRALERRCRTLLDEGLHVLIVGDMNLTPARIDSARELQAPPELDAVRPGRQWLSQLLRPAAGSSSCSGRAAFVDCFRQLHPTERVYTCFHVASGADTTNFGSRIDLALLAPPPVLAAPAMPASTAAAAVAASPPHLLSALAAAPSASAPIGTASTASERPPPVAAPRLSPLELLELLRGGQGGPERSGQAGAAESDGWPEAGWLDGGDEHDGNRALPQCASAPSASAHPLVLRSCTVDSAEDRSDHVPLRVEIDGVRLPPQPPPPPPLSSAVRLGGQRLLSSFLGASTTAPTPGNGVPSSHAHASASTSSSRHPAAIPAVATSAVTHPPRMTQGNLGGFLARPAAQQGHAAPAALGGDARGGDACGAASGTPAGGSGGLGSAADAGALRSHLAPPVPHSQSAAGWQALFQRANENLPKCRHGEPAKRQTVKKAGPNQGRHFFSCQRPEGPRTNREANWYALRPYARARARMLVPGVQALTDCDECAYVLCLCHRQRLLPVGDRGQAQARGRWGGRPRVM
jgi:exodeoxyribonuclease III